ncbi:sigma-E processing peptidase SpoIIGA [Paenibacillus protaetiae]|uniref:Sporulation sigma-E factor-processing peptidase n=1 Tax=Paenibacillus protaetiae TaxID=2509456 RepID=A0A4P6ESN7_9BACL|nr:sigma-E processing peptidase SpoIIGA [Paenibacillus protaetiae]QAY65425.1 sigma-E processing peptidase SpoIIGA [Paenibacillus protaetiae]
MAVYIDVVFLQELLIDGGILLTTAWVRHVRANPWRVLAAASIGACYVVLMLFPPLSFMYTLAVKVALSFLILWVAFGFGSLQFFSRNVAAFYTVNFVALGAVLGFHYLLMKGSASVWKTMTLNGSGGVDIEMRMGAVYMLAALSIGLYIYRAVWSQKRKAAQVQSHTASVKVTIGESVRSCIGLVDTGNQLYDPLSRSPVMVMEAALWNDALPASWLEGIKHSQVDRLIADLDGETFEWRDRLRLVPYRGINRGTQFMLALRPDAVIVEREGQVYESRKVLVGLDGGKLAADGAYQAIIHPSLVQQVQ